MERVLAGKRYWWFLGPGGVAKIPNKEMTADGELRPQARQRLQDLGLYTSAAPRNYLLTVLTSTDCNLGCGYCSQNAGQDLTGGNRPRRG
jgi:uncharacterized protein